MEMCVGIMCHNSYRRQGGKKEKVLLSKKKRRQLNKF